MYFSLKQIIDSLPEKKNSKSSFWVKLIIRKVSFIFTYCFINLGASAWSVSILSVIIALLGSLLMMFDDYCLTIIGVLLIEFWLVLDCVDGNIARCKKECSEMGSFVDALSGYYISAFLYFSVGIAAYHFSNLIEYRQLFIIMGAFSSISGILARLIHQKYTYTILVTGNKENEKGLVLPEDEVNDKNSIQYIRSRIDKELGLSGLLMPFLLLASILNYYDLFTVFYFVFQLGTLVAVTIYYSIKGKQ